MHVGPGIISANCKCWHGGGVIQRVIQTDNSEERRCSHPSDRPCCILPACVRNPGAASPGRNVLEPPAQHLSVALVHKDPPKVLGTTLEVSEGHHATRPGSGGW